MKSRDICRYDSLQCDEMRIASHTNLTISDLNSIQDHHGSSSSGVFIFVLVFNVCYCLTSNLLIYLTKAFLESIPPGRKLVMPYPISITLLIDIEVIIAGYLRRASPRSECSAVRDHPHAPGHHLQAGGVQLLWLQRHLPHH